MMSIMKMVASNLTIIGSTLDSEDYFIYNDKYDNDDYDDDAEQF